MRSTRSRRTLSSLLSVGSVVTQRILVLAALLLLGCFSPAMAAPTAPPKISSFAASSDTITQGESTTLSWSVTDATSISISPSPGTVHDTSITVSPKATTTYTLTATNAKGKVTAKTAVTVHPLPAITKFTASRTKTSAGATVTLTWTTTNATTLSIDQSVGTLAKSTGTTNVTVDAKTTYTLTATNDYGTATATVTVETGDLPAISSFAAESIYVAKGKSTTLKWQVSNAGDPKKYPLTINQSVGKVSGGAVKITPTATTTYTLTATNDYGSVTATAKVSVGTAPVISKFGGAPAALLTGSGQTSQLSWTVAGAESISIDMGIGAVSTNSTVVGPKVTTTYTLTAVNLYGTSTAKATVTVGDLPKIDAFISNPNVEAGPGNSGLLTWSTTNATAVKIDNNVGAVPATQSSFKVNPTKTTTYTLTATNAVGSVTAKATVNYRPLATITANKLYYSEHCLFLVPDAGLVNWDATSTADKQYLYQDTNSDKFTAILKKQFPDDYFMVVVTANNLKTNSVPNVWPRRHMADGINQCSTDSTAAALCRYHIGQGNVIDGCFGVLDHEIGHAWGIFLRPNMSNNTGHWFANSTCAGQMAETYTDDGGVTTKQIVGTQDAGFTWQAVDNIAANETETFSEQDLYLMGLARSFPEIYVLDTPVYNSDHTVTYNGVAKYDQAYVEATYGVRNPSYQTSPKRLRMGFIYVARNFDEIKVSYQAVERSIVHFTTAEAIDTKKFRFQVPFLVDTKYRASVDALLKDLDGNTTPTLTITGQTYMTSTDGTATIPYTASDKEGTVTVSCVTPDTNYTVANNQVVITGMAPGTHFITLKAEDASGKKCFAHCVVDVQSN